MYEHIIYIAILSALLFIQLKNRNKNKDLLTKFEEQSCDLALQRTEVQKLNREKIENIAQMTEWKVKWEGLDRLYDDILAQKNLLDAQNIASQKDISSLQTESYMLKETCTKLKQEKEQLKLDAEKTYERLNALLSDRFKSIAQSIIDTRSEEFKAQSSNHLNNLLSPLKMRLEDFNKQVRESDKERYNLKEQLREMNATNLNLIEQTHNLSAVLKGNNKIQGTWGEIVLERILEISGLHKNTQFTCQKTLPNSENDPLKPDAVLYLPNNKHVIIDAKTSFKSYEAYCNAEETKTKNHFLKEFSQSVKKHIKELAAKNYHHIKTLNTVDFVIMFIPIEEAFLLAYQDTYQLAWENSIIIASPTTIVPTLRIINFIWKENKQKENYKKIAHSAGVIHDKICSILDDIKKMKQFIDGLYHKSNEIWEDTQNKKIRGKGGIISHLNELEKLGASAKKEAIPEDA